MMSKHLNFTASLGVTLLVITAVACNKRPATLYPWGWEALGRPTDSLMVTMQEAFLGDASLDSCTRLVVRFQEYASRPDAPAIEKARATFWNGRLAFASENYDEALALFRKSLSETDSARYPYDAKYIHLCLEPLEGKVLDGRSLNWEWYRDMVNDLDFALKNDARVFGAIRAQYLSCVMTYSGNPSRALRYALIADSLFTGVGRDGDRLTNRMNVASNRILVGDTVGAIKDYTWMQRELDNGVVPVSPLLKPLIDYNKWVETNDTTALMKLKEQTRHNIELKGYDALASAYLAEIEIKSHDTDSLTLRLKDMEAGVESTDDAFQKAFVIKMIARAYESLGMPDIALCYLNSYPEVVENNMEALASDRYSVAETEHQISELERQGELERINLRVRTTIFLAALAIVVLLLAALAYRRLSRLRREKEEGLHKLEKAKRSELSMTLSVREKERQIEDLRSKVSSLVDDELINSDAARELEASIRSEAGASKADEEFGNVFATISPDFRRRLTEKYPRIGRNTLRMAEYIAIGMDNRHIARVMNIRPESVKQNRWRLRQALGLDADDNLDKILREML